MIRDWNGKPWGFPGYPRPYPRKPVPMPRGTARTGFEEYRCGFCKNPGVYNPCTGMPPKPNEKPRNSSAGVN